MSCNPSERSIKIPACSLLSVVSLRGSMSRAGIDQFRRLSRNELWVEKQNAISHIQSSIRIALLARADVHVVTAK
jgi:hypothetical protein